MDRLRVLLDAVEQRERQRLAAANQAVADTLDRSRHLAVIGTLLIAALFLFIAAMITLRLSLVAVERLNRVTH
mgnify:CR=1 FL=1